MIEITICGYDTHHQEARSFEHPFGLSDYLLLIVRAESWFLIDGKRTDILPGMLILFDRNTYIHYGKDIPGYNDDWIHFHMSDEDREQFLAPLSASLNRPLYLHDYYSLSHYVQLITNAFHSTHVQKNLVLDAIMRALLCNIHNLIVESSNPYTAHKYFSACSKLRTEMYNAPLQQWSAISMAGQLEISVSYFQHIYKQFFGNSCQQDIIKARLELAKFYLGSSNMKIKSLAKHCGYENEFHFIRQFKRFVGMPPKQYRDIHLEKRP